MAKPKVYVETSVIGYLTARPSRDLIVAACQQATQEWWTRQAERFDLYVSVVVVREATVHDMDYLLTWNCKHIANPMIQKKIAALSRQRGYELPTICTPYEFLEA